MKTERHFLFFPLFNTCNQNMPSYYQLRHFINVLCLTVLISAQGQLYPRHYYGANAGNIGSGTVPLWGPAPVVREGTLAPHVCGFNPFTRKCMDPENYCPGRCMNFRYTYNTLYDCRCLAI